MSDTLFPDHIVVVRPQQRKPGPATRGQIREKAYAADGIWVGYCDISARDEPGEWHHHADYDSVMYLLSGRCRIDHGVSGELSTIMSAGDFGFFGKGVIHRVQVLDDGRCDYVFFRLGNGESVVRVAGPGSRVDVSAEPPNAASTQPSSSSAIDLPYWRGAPRPQRINLDGRYVRLEPLDPSAHGDELYEVVAGSEAERLHQYLADPIPTSRADFDNWLLPKAASEDPLFFAVVDKATGRVEGRQSLMDISTDNGSAEVGHILWGPKIARSRITTEAFFLMADYAFGLGYRRWQWRCNARNTPSRRAAERFGYKFEGISRQSGVVKGKSRDTAWFSIIDSEWPRLRIAFEAWLDPRNFDEFGQQRTTLEFQKQVAGAIG
jgi:RimJ/RimL family protein N-acetyltransferase/uncharacterized RmlC-like cupin family protein